MPQPTELIIHLKETPVDDLPQITDAMYEGDPHGTNADKLYFVENVHNYMKHLAMALLPKNTKFVSSAFSDSNGSLQDPFFTSIMDAYDQINLEHSADTNKYLIYIYNTDTVYEESSFDFNSDGYVILEGVDKYGTVLSGTMYISKGVHIFRNILITGDINISGGNVIFENCGQTSGDIIISSGTVHFENCGQTNGDLDSDINISGGTVHFENCEQTKGIKNISGDTVHFKNCALTSGDINIGGGTVRFENCAQMNGKTSITAESTVLISKADYWGPVIISNGIDNLNLWCEDILNMGKDPDQNHSIVVPDDLDTSQIVLRRVAIQGDCVDTGKHINEVSGLEENVLAKPIV